jgi:hypothetical protein
MQCGQAESNVVQVVAPCNSEDMWWSSVAAVCAECVNLMVVIGKVTCVHCTGETNEVAHTMAWYCNDSKFSCNRVNETPVVS